MFAERIAALKEYAKSIEKDAELLRGVADEFKTREIAKQSIFEYIEVYYNRMHRHSAIGSIAPEAFENQCKMFA